MLFLFVCCVFLLLFCLFFGCCFFLTCDVTCHRTHATDVESFFLCGGGGGCIWAKHMNYAPNERRKGKTNVPNPTLSTDSIKVFVQPPVCKCTHQHPYARYKLQALARLPLLRHTKILHTLVEMERAALATVVAHSGKATRIVLKKKKKKSSLQQAGQI